MHARIISTATALMLFLFTSLSVAQATEFPVKGADQATAVKKDVPKTYTEQSDKKEQGGSCSKTCTKDTCSISCKVGQAARCRCDDLGYSHCTCF